MSKDRVEWPKRKLIPTIDDNNEQLESDYQRRLRAFFCDHFGQACSDLNAHFNSNTRTFTFAGGTTITDTELHSHPLWQEKLIELAVLANHRWDNRDKIEEQEADSKQQMGDAIEKQLCLACRYCISERCKAVPATLVSSKPVPNPLWDEAKFGLTTERWEHPPAPGCGCPNWRQRT